MKRHILITTLLLPLFSLPARADLAYSDLPMSVATGAMPNVALIFDNSSSMATADTGGTGSITSVCNGASKTLPLTRLDALKEAACQAVTDNATSMRIGLYRFNGGTSGTGLQLVNFGGTSTSLKPAINAIVADQSSLLSPAFKTVVNDYIGANSPIQYRCQKNYTVFATDGLPTVGQDVSSVLSLPVMSPVQPSYWTGNNTTASPGWDGFIDPLISAATPYYPWLDDFAQFAYDVDTKTPGSLAPNTSLCGFVMTGVAGKDCSGKGWNGEDDHQFPDPIRNHQQNIITHMIGIGAEANNELMRDTTVVTHIYLEPKMVNAESDTLTIPRHGLATGDYVHYYAQSISSTIPASANAATDVLTGDTTGMTNGVQLTYSNAGGTSLKYDVITPAGICGSIGGLTSGNNYYVATRSANEFRLATGPSNATTCAAAADGSLNAGAYCLNLTSTGVNNTLHTFYKSAAPAVTATMTATGSGTLPVNTTSNIEKITIPAHGLNTGDVIQYTCANGSAIITPTTSATYYAVVVDATHFKLATSAANATAPTPITVDISNAGNPYQTFSFAYSKDLIGGLFAYETDALTDATPDPATEPAARGKYFVEVVDSNNIKLRACGNIGCTTSAPVAVDITSTGYGFLSASSGKSYFATTASGLTTAMQSVFTSIGANQFRTDYESIDRATPELQIVNTTSLATTTSQYQSMFDPGDWSGDLYAFSLNQVSGDLVKPEVWKASQQISPPAMRNIITWNGINAVVFPKSALTGLIASQLSSLNNDPKVVDWIRGADDITLIGSRIRSNGVLGDIANSKPVRVEQPNQNYDVTLPASMIPCVNQTCTGKENYAAFKAAPRTPMLYVGANDGMLHGFNENTGVEQFAFIPNGVYSDWVDTNNNGIMDGPEVAIKKFYELTQNGYGFGATHPHRYFVDGTPTTGDAFFSDHQWHTVLVGGLGRGGRSVYALDVTDPNNFYANKVLWEFNDNNSGNMGYSYSQPQIVRLQNGVWAAIFGNGYDGANDLARLFVVNLQTGALIKRIDFTSPASGPNGLSTPTVSNDNTGTAVAVYAGDLKGNVWKVDISNNNPVFWPSSLSVPFFTAMDVVGNPQPITAPITLGTNPQGGVMLYVGTGSYMTTQDKNYNYSTSPVRNDTMYALWDNGSYINPNKIGLVQQTQFTWTSANSETYRIVSNYIVDYSGGKNGWYINLVDGSNYQGERINAAPLLNGSRLIFSTIIPPANDPCIAKTDALFMEVDALTGGMVSTPFFDTNMDGYVNLNDAPVSGFTINMINGKDYDNDGVVNGIDNCPVNTNADQKDSDFDGIGDICDATPYGPDGDGDGVADMFDNCPAVINADQLDTDGDKQGDACDTDNDNDGMPDVWEILYGLNPFVNDANGDLDGDGISNLQEYLNGTNPSVVHAMKNDFNADKTSDVLWYDNVAGNINIWNMQNGALANWNFIGYWPDTANVPSLTGDIDNDKDSDILWYNNTTGDVDAWIMQAGARVDWTFLGYWPDANITPVLVGDFDSDGDDDILWYNNLTGDVDIWVMQGGARVDWLYVGYWPDANFKPVLVGDFDGDGDDDILWWNNVTGDVDIWVMQNNIRSNWLYVGYWADTNNKPIGVGDFNHDGIDDILWYNSSTGDVNLWTMQANARSNWTWIGSWPDTNNHIEEIGDFNGDGTADILWRNISTGAVTAWPMLNGVKQSGQYIATFPGATNSIKAGL